MAPSVRFSTTGLHLAEVLEVIVPSSCTQCGRSRSRQSGLRRDSVFWHQTLRSILTHPSSLLCHRILRLPRGSFIARYTKIFITFSLSGLLHAIAELGGGLALQDSGTLRFFCTQVLGIMIEDSVQVAYRSLCNRSVPHRSAPWMKVIGYAWVLMFFFWSTPAWLYPNAAKGAAQGFLPFRVMSGY